MIRNYHKIMTKQVFMEMFHTDYHCQSLFFKVRIIPSALDKDLDAKATGFSILSSTTPPQLHKEMHHKLTLAALMNHNGLIQKMIEIASWLHQMQCVEFLSMSTLNPPVKGH